MRLEALHNGMVLDELHCGMRNGESPHLVVFLSAEVLLGTGFLFEFCFLSQD